MARITQQSSLSAMRADLSGVSSRLFDIQRQVASGKTLGAPRMHRRPRSSRFATAAPCEPSTSTNETSAMLPIGSAPLTRRSAQSMTV